jgi:hypothetical protein
MSSYPESARSKADDTLQRICSAEGADPCITYAELAVLQRVLLMAKEAGQKACLCSQSKAPIRAMDAKKPACTCNSGIATTLISYNYIRAHNMVWLHLTAC